MDESGNENVGENYNEARSVDEVIKRKRKPNRRKWKMQENKAKRQKREYYKGVRKK